MLMRRLLFGTANLCLCACANPASSVQLAPVPAPGEVTLAMLYERADAATRAKEPPNASEIVVVRADSVVFALSLYELKDIFWLDVYVLNSSSKAFTLNPSQLVLMDGARIALRQLRPDEAANLYASGVTTIPPYQPKYTYNVQSSYYNNGTTQTTVTAQEDPYNALGYDIGAAILADRNARLVNLAASLYASGLIEGSQIPATTAAEGGVYWLKATARQGPLTLRFTQSGYEVAFTAGAVPGPPRPPVSTSFGPPPSP